MTRPSRRGRSLPLTESQESTGTVDGDVIDWPTSPAVDEEAIDKWKQPVVAATTAAVTLSTGLNVGDTIDGVTLADGDRVLVKDQALPEENGIYVVGATPELAPDFDDPSDIVGAVVLVTDGTANTGTVWYVDLIDAPVMGIDPITFAEFGGGSALTPASTVEDETTWGIAPAVGTDLEYARQDHTHGSPPEPDPVVAYSPVSVTDDGGDHYYLLCDGDGTPVLVEV